MAACRHHTSTVVCDSTVSLVLSRAVGAMGGGCSGRGVGADSSSAAQKGLAPSEHGRSGLVQVPEAHASGWALWGGRFLPVKQRCRGESTASVGGIVIVQEKTLLPCCHHCVPPVSDSLPTSCLSLCLKRQWIALRSSGKEGTNAPHPPPPQTRPAIDNVDLNLTRPGLLLALPVDCTSTQPSNHNTVY